MQKIKKFTNKFATAIDNTKKGKIISAKTNF